MVKLKNAAILSLFVVFLPFLSLSQNNELTPEMVVQLKSVTDVDLSPEGNIIVYSVRIPRSIQEEPGPAYSELWLFNRQISEKRQLTPSGIISRTPQWSSDGNYIAFISQRCKHNTQSQVYVLPVEGGETFPLTSAPSGVRSFRRSTDGETIAYTETDPLSAEQESQHKKGFNQRVVDQDHRYHRLLSKLSI